MQIDYKQMCMWAMLTATTLSSVAQAGSYVPDPNNPDVTVDDAVAEVNIATAITGDDTATVPGMDTASRSIYRKWEHANPLNPIDMPTPVYLSNDVGFTVKVSATTVLDPNPNIFRDAFATSFMQAYVNPGLDGEESYVGVGVSGTDTDTDQKADLIAVEHDVYNVNTDSYDLVIYEDFEISKTVTVGLNGENYTYSQGPGSSALQNSIPVTSRLRDSTLFRSYLRRSKVRLSLASGQ